MSSWCSNKIISWNRSREVKTCWRWTSLGSGTRDKQTSVAAVNIEGSAQQAVCLYFSGIKQTHSDYMRGKTWSSNNSSQVEECLGRIPWMFIPLSNVGNCGGEHCWWTLEKSQSSFLSVVQSTTLLICDIIYKLSGCMCVEDVFCSFFPYFQGKRAEPLSLFLSCIFKQIFF